MSTKPKSNVQKQTAAPPVAKVRIGLITASIWERQTDNGGFYSVTFERRYRDGEGNFKTSHSYDAQDLLALGKAADLAHSKILELQASEA